MYDNSNVEREKTDKSISFFFQAEDGIRGHCVTGFRRVLFRSGVMTKVFFPSNSILLIRPAPVKLSKNLDSLECDKLAFVRSEVVLMPSCPDCSVTVSKSATICILVL